MFELVNKDVNAKLPKGVLGDPISQPRFTDVDSPICFSTIVNCALDNTEETACRDTKDMKGCRKNFAKRIRRIDQNGIKLIIKAVTLAFKDQVVQFGPGTRLYLKGDAALPS